jgi:cytochrome c2
MSAGRHLRTVPALVAVALLSVGIAACAGEAPAVLTGGNAGRGHALILRYGCGSCHTISGVDGANGKVGPSLADFADYRYIIGMLPRTPENTARWIEHPRQYLPQGAMPDLGVTPAEARDIAVYLYGQ